jgi:hypothetical protein
MFLQEFTVDRVILASMDCQEKKAGRVLMEKSAETAKREQKVTKVNPGSSRYTARGESHNVLMPIILS